MIRFFATYLRRCSERRQSRETLLRFREWSAIVDAWEPPASPASSPASSLALVRLDDIGDYLLWRNTLPFYRGASLAAGKKVVLIGNIVWKPVFEAFDRAFVDDAIWVDKHRYFADSAYREELWRRVRSDAFSVFVCPSRTRPLLLDDMFARAAAARISIAVHNTLGMPELNIDSDAVYSQLFRIDQTHEYFYNQQFVRLLNPDVPLTTRPVLPLEISGSNKQLVCFIGASAKSKTWPLDYWITLVRLLQEAGFTPLLAGGKRELDIAEKIVEHTAVDSVVARLDLPETLQVIADAEAVVSGDTMAAHAAVACGKPLVILANGVNAHRFVAYEEAGIDKVSTLYTRQYRQAGKPAGFVAVSRDMYSIAPASALDALRALFR